MGFCLFACRDPGVGAGKQDGNRGRTTNVLANGAPNRGDLLKQTSLFCFTPEPAGGAANVACRAEARQGGYDGHTAEAGCC